MINAIFQEIRNRTEYISEVQRHIHAVLAAFQQDARSKGRRIKFAANAPDSTTGSSIELTDVIDGKGNGSSVVLEVNCTGDVMIWRSNTIEHSPEHGEVERRPLDLSQPAIATAADVLLIIADDHRGFVGNLLENYLNTGVFATPQVSPQNPENSL